MVAQSAALVHSLSVIHQVYQKRRLRVCALQVVALLVVFCGVVLQASAQSARPGMGATPYADAGGTGVTFRVWSPNATSVAVRGSFNGWGSTTMTEEGTSDLWSVDVPDVPNGAQYKYFINGMHWWKDPRSRQVTTSGYQSGSANSIVYFPNAFNWQGTTRLPVANSNLVIYQLHVGSFYDPTPSSGGPGKFTNVVAKLDHIAGLGANAIELLPIWEFPGENSWGYNPADIYAVENSAYGGPDGLKTLVREAHSRGMHVILDAVHNHYGPTDLELYGFDVGSASRFYFYTNAGGIASTPWGDRPNYANAGVRSFISDNFKMWLDEYRVDGFRWDAVGAMRRYDAGGGSYISIPEADTLIQSINATVIDSNAISIAEDDSAGMGFDGEWAHGFASTLINELVKTNDTSRDMTQVYGSINGSGFARVIFSESHDLVGDLNGAGTQRLPKRIDTANPASYAARKRSMLAAASVFTAPGIPMFFMGQEMLEDAQFSSSYALDWSHAGTFSAVTNLYRDLIRLRRNLDGVSPGLLGPNITWHVTRNDAPWKLLAFHRWGAGANDQVMVIMNFTSNTIPNYVINTWPASGSWYVNFNSDWTRYGNDFSNYGSGFVTVSGGSGGFAIGPYSTLVLSRTALPNLDSDGDGLSNGWEQTYFGSPLAAGANGDNDGDGASNLHEQAANTNPTNAISVLRFTTLQTTNNNIELRWTGGQSVRQIIQQTTNLAGPWTSLFTNLAPTPITNSLTVSNLSVAPRYFRVQVLP